MTSRNAGRFEAFAELAIGWPAEIYNGVGFRRGCLFAPLTVAFRFVFVFAWFFWCLAMFALFLVEALADFVIWQRRHHEIGRRDDVS